MNKINYQKELEHLIDKLPDHHRRLFLHRIHFYCTISHDKKPDPQL